MRETSPLVDAAGTHQDNLQCSNSPVLDPPCQELVLCLHHSSIAIKWNQVFKMRELAHLVDAAGAHQDNNLQCSYSAIPFLHCQECFKYLYSITSLSLRICSCLPYLHLLGINHQVLHTIQTHQLCMQHLHFLGIGTKHQVLHT